MKTVAVPVPQQRKQNRMKWTKSLESLQKVNSQPLVVLRVAEKRDQYHMGKSARSYSLNVSLNYGIIIITYYACCVIVFILQLFLVIKTAL